MSAPATPPGRPQSPERPATPESAQDTATPPAPLSRRPLLSERDVALLEFEHGHWLKSAPAAPGPKEAAIREEFGISPTRYYQLLNGLLDSEAALARHPVMINRLRAVRESRRIARQ